MSSSLDAYVQRSGHLCEKEVQTAKGFSIKQLDFGSA